MYLRHIENEGEKKTMQDFISGILLRLEMIVSFGVRMTALFFHITKDGNRNKTEKENTEYKMEESVVMVWQKPI